MAASRPPHAYQAGQIETHLGGGPRLTPDAERTISATYPSAEVAGTVFQTLRQQVPPGAMLTRFGQSILFSYPIANGDVAPIWRTQLQQQQGEVSAENETNRLTFSISAIAPSVKHAKELEQECIGYFSRPDANRLLSPWSPDLSAHPNSEVLRKRRRVLGELIDGPRLGGGAELMERLRARNADRPDDLKKRLEELTAERKAAQARQFTEIRARGDAEANQILDLYQRLGNVQDEADRSAIDLELSAQLGLMPGDPPAEDRTGGTSAWVRRGGLTVLVQYVFCVSPADGVTSFAQWLEREECVDLHYEFSLTDINPADEDM